MLTLLIVMVVDARDAAATVARADSSATTCQANRIACPDLSGRVLAGVRTPGHLSLVEAVDAWLADDDATAVPALAHLAQDGDADAQVFLGRIATRTLSPYLAGLPRSARNAILRAPGGLSGKSWITVAASAGQPLAQAFAAGRMPPYSIGNVEALLSMGEVSAATQHLLRSVPSGPMAGIDALIEGGSLPPSSRYAAWLSVVEHAKLTEAMFEILRQSLSVDDPGPIIVLDRVAKRYGMKRTARFEEMADVLLGSARLFIEVKDELFSSLMVNSYPGQSLARFCSQACPDAFHQCLSDTVVLISGYDESWRLTSPVESMVSAERYNQSPRAVAEVIRLIREKSDRWSDLHRWQLAQQSCAASAAFGDE